MHVYMDIYMRNRGLVSVTSDNRLQLGGDRDIDDDGGGRRMHVTAA
jgi:hypothetical protein